MRGATRFGGCAGVCGGVGVGRRFGVAEILRGEIRRGWGRVSQKSGVGGVLGGVWDGGVFGGGFKRVFWQTSLFVKKWGWVCERVRGTVYLGQVSHFLLVVVVIGGCGGGGGGAGLVKDQRGW